MALKVALKSSGGNCPDNDMKQAESIILEAYPAAHREYAELLAKITGPHVVTYTANDLDRTRGYDVVVKESCGGVETSDSAKTFHLDAGFPRFTATAGFLVTTLAARSYSSRTAPDPADPTHTKTLNVLGLDGSSGMRPALVALLHYHYPFEKPAFLIRPNWGLAVSAGPVLDVSNGKADVSRLGLFTGISMHLWNLFYVTPGFHVGEFADFPQGFTHAGQIIPTGTGTPVPTKRYTARFAFSITFDPSNLSKLTGGGSAAADNKQTPASQPKK